MKININIEECNAEMFPHKVYLTATSDGFGFTGVDLCTLDNIEDIELQLTNIVKKLYDYRKAKEANS